MHNFVSHLFGLPLYQKYFFMSSMTLSKLNNIQEYKSIMIYLLICLLWTFKLFLMITILNNIIMNNFVYKCLSNIWFIPIDNFLEENDWCTDKQKAHLRFSFILFCLSHHVCKENTKLSSMKFVQISILTTWVERTHVHLIESPSTRTVFPRK